MCVVGGDKEECASVCVCGCAQDGGGDSERERGFVACSLSAVIRHR